MSHLQLKSCIEASNALRNATEETVNSCFSEIVNDVFGGKRNLLRLLLSPRSTLKQQQMDNIKQVFHTKFQKLIENPSNADINAIDIHKESTPIIPTLINIAEPTQVIIINKSIEKCVFLNRTGLPCAIGLQNGY
eukprot:420643_1